MVVFTFSVLIGSTRFRQIWSKKYKLSVSAEIWCLDQFEYAELNGDVLSFYFRPEILFLGKFGPKN